MLNKIKKNSPWWMSLNILIMLIVGSAAVLVFFMVFLPSYTNHGLTVTVPDLRGLSVEEAASALEAKELRYEVTDSVFSPEYKPNQIVAHYPEDNVQVKPSRKIFITLNMSNVPTVQLPDVIDASIKEARLTIENLGFEIGDIEYVPDLATNAVLSIRIDEKEYKKEDLEEGLELPKGTKIGLSVGNGLGNDELVVPNLMGMPLEEAEQYLLGMELGVGHIEYVDTATVDLGTIIKQFPESNRGAVVKVGSIIDLWVAGFYPELMDSTFLDEPAQ
ncbi:PASTA domain-containing protein [Flammeovirgaceae bacterium SG7u.111]|nr:PASTA domain-containing protein [Flammeovirgaceae bacterium SG7u.132]WPO36835.1 PASTA domain-containing protein [Flammeovirgaceae bacterium SG7u.111]